MRLLLVCLLLAITIRSAPVLAQDVTPAPDTPVLNPGDAVRITVWRKPDLSGEFFVGADSSIAHPFYAEVKVGGVPFPSAADRVQRHVARFETSPRVLVEPLFQVIVMGEVRQPKLYTLRPEITVAQAVGLAGGGTERGRLERVQLLRDGQVHLIDLTQPSSGLGQTPIRSGDQIVVPRRRDVFREYIAPSASVTAALVALLNVVISANRDRGTQQPEQ